MREHLDIGLTLRRVFETYIRYLGTLLIAALLVFIPVDALSGLVLSTSANVIWGVLAAVIGLVGTYWYQGVVVETVYESQATGSDISLRHLFQAVWPRVPALIAVGVLGGIAIVIGLILVIVPGLVLATWWALLAPVIVVERGRWYEAFGRSRGLVRGNGWEVFAVILVVFLILVGVSAGLAALGGGTLVGQSLASLVAHVFTAPITALAASIMYFELRGPRSAPEPAEQQGTA